MKLSKEQAAEARLQTATDASFEPAQAAFVRSANFDKQALDKKVRLGHLRNMLMADVQRKDAIQKGLSSQHKPKNKVRKAMTFKVEDNDSNDSIAKEHAILNSSFAEQRRYAKGALEKLEMPDSPSYHLAENKVDFNPENVAVPSRVDVHEGKAANKLMNEIFSWLISIFAAVIIAFVFVTFIAQRNIVDGSSMYPTLHNGDNLIVEKLSRYFSLPPYGTIITFIKPKLQISYSEDSNGKIKREVKEMPELADTHLVKRVIALPGDSVEIKDGQVYLNGKQLNESYLPNKVLTNVEDPYFAKVTLADDEIFVLGDNREHSSDSRYFGPIKVKSIVGRSLFRFYPFSRAGVPR